MHQYYLFASMCSQWLKKHVGTSRGKFRSLQWPKLKEPVFFPPQPKHIVIPNPSTINNQHENITFLYIRHRHDIFKHVEGIQRKRLQAISFSTDFRPWNPNASKKAAFPRRPWWETVGSRNRCLLWDILCHKLQKNNVFSNKTLTN